MRRLLETLVHERLVMALIAINSIVLILRGYAGWRERTDDLLFWTEYILTAYFVLEMGVKRGLQGRRFWSNGWNCYDFAIVAVSSPVLLVPLLDGGDIGVVLVLRSVRILRLMRGFRFIPDRDRLWSGVRRALRASVGVFLALVIYNVILGLGANALFAGVAPEHFGDPLRSMYSLFKVFTVEGWFDVPDRIAAASSPGMGWLARGYFTAAVLSGGVLGLSIANAVFVDEMVIDNTVQIEKLLLQRFEQLAASQEAQTRALARLESRLEQSATRRD
jgi:voltage-gated sodium channel